MVNLLPEILMQSQWDRLVGLMDYVHKTGRFIHKITIAHSGDVMVVEITHSPSLLDYPFQVDHYEVRMNGDVNPPEEEE